MLYTHANIITVDSDRRIIEDGAIYLQGDIIKDLDKTSTLLAKYPQVLLYDLSGRIVIPGLISTHMHTVPKIDTGTGGTADNKELHSWLDDRIRPLQNAMTSEDAYVSVQLSVAEMLKSGTTCFLESMVCITYPCSSLLLELNRLSLKKNDLTKHRMSSFLDDIISMDSVEWFNKAEFEAAWAILLLVLQQNMRFQTARYLMWWRPGENGMALQMIESGYGLGLLRRDCKTSVTSLRYYYLDKRTMIRIVSRAPRSRMEELASVAHSHGIPITMHCAETRRRRRQFEYFASLGSPVSWADATGLLSPSTVLVHMVRLDKDKDIPKLAASGTHIAHCPTSNAS